MEQNLDKLHFTKQMHTFFKIIFIFTLFCFSFTLGLSINSLLLINTSLSANGTVINLIENKSTDTYSPRIRFKASNGQIITFISSFGSKPALFYKGEIISVLYKIDKDTIINPQVNSFESIWLLPLIFGFIGFISIFILIVSKIILNRIKNGKSVGIYIYTKFYGKELLYFLKPNKKCPMCNELLHKEKIKIDKGEGFFDSMEGSSFGNRYKIKYLYKCNNCTKKFSLKELIEKKPSNH